MTNLEMLKEVVTVASILIKFEAEDILAKGIFWTFLEELGIKSPNGSPISKYYVNRAVNELSRREKAELLSEFNEGHESLYRQMEMYSKP